MEIISIGNELLIGKTLNTNATWIAKRVTALGLKVSRIEVIGDNVEEIAETLQESLKRKPSIIITTGGLGPTFDDKTIEGIAKGLDRKLKVNAKALKMVKEKYKMYSQQRKIKSLPLTPARIKMATMPENTIPLANPVGTAPGMMAKAKETVIIALPGVPPEMEAIFNESLEKLFKKKAGKSGYFEVSIFAEGIMESTLAPLIDKVMHDEPYVYIKSHVYTESSFRTEGQKSHIELHLSTTADSKETAEKRLNSATSELTELIEKMGAKTRK